MKKVILGMVFVFGMSFTANAVAKELNWDCFTSHVDHFEEVLGDLTSEQVNAIANHCTN